MLKITKSIFFLLGSGSKNVSDLSPYKGILRHNCGPKVQQIASKHFKNMAPNQIISCDDTTRFTCTQQLL